MAAGKYYTCKLTASAPLVLYFPDPADQVGRITEVSNNTKYLTGTSGTATFVLNYAQYNLAMMGPSGQFIQAVGTSGTAGIDSGSFPVALVTV